MGTELSVAIVDNYPRWRTFLDKYLTEQGFSTYCKSANGKELLAHLECTDSLPALCILDINMPVMDGYETAQRLKAAYPSIRILAFSMSVGRGIVNRMMECGAHGFLAKGVAPPDIKAALHQLMEKEPQSTF